MIISSRLKNYSVDFVNDFQIENDKNTFYVIDKNVYEIYSNSFASLCSENICIIEAIEQNKNLNTVVYICKQMLEMSAKRNTHLVSIGGGIVQDITGFVANILYRGIKWTFYPTTLLAACDSCIGGKTSLNFEGYKNILGTFYPPDEICIYAEVFKTLSEKDYQSGLGEVVKFNVMTGKNAISEVKSNLNKLLQRDSQTIELFVRRSLAYKKTFIEEDEFDKGIRVMLNFAHTFGHAFETTSNYKIPHGSAVALGMVVANRVSYNRGWLELNYVEEIEEMCVKILNLELQEEWFKYEKIKTAIRKDKKQIDNNIRAVLIKSDYSLEVCEVEENEIKEAVSFLDFFLKRIKN